MAFLSFSNIKFSGAAVVPKNIKEIRDLSFLCVVLICVM